MGVFFKVTPPTRSNVVIASRGHCALAGKLTRLIDIIKIKIAIWSSCFWNMFIVQFSCCSCILKLFISITSKLIVFLWTLIYIYLNVIFSFRVKSWKLQNCKNFNQITCWILLILHVYTPKTVSHLFLHKFMLIKSLVCTQNQENLTDFLLHLQSNCAWRIQQSKLPTNHSMLFLRNKCPVYVTMDMYNKAFRNK